MSEEAYCVDSGRPVGPLGGDRCKSHGAADTPCYVAFRDPRCEHPDWPKWANGSDRCPECRARVTPPGCICPSGLGYRFHRHPCPRTGEIEPRVTAPGGKS